jgi:hypothetical protein
MRVLMVAMAAMVMVRRLGEGRSRKHERKGEYEKLLHGFILATSRLRTCGLFFTGHSRVTTLSHFSPDAKSIELR